MKKKYNQTILLISPEPWGQNKVSKHHYALELAKRGNKVFFLNPNSGSFQLRNERNNLFVVDYKEPIRGLSFLPKIIQSLYFLLLVKYLEYKVGKRFDVLWNFDSSRFYELSMLNEKVRICHIVDMNQNFHRDQLAKSSDVCFCTSDFILDDLKPFNNKVYKIHHGFKVSEKIVDVEEQFDSNKIQVGYIGNLTIKYLDWELVYQVAVNSLSVDFYFIGNSARFNVFW